MAQSFEVCHRLAGEALAKLVDQAGLANAGLAADAQDLTLATHRGLETAREELELAVAADERRGPTPLTRPGPAAAHQGKGAAVRGCVLLELIELEPSRQERGRTIADGHRGDRAAIDQSRERGERCLPAGVSDT